MTFLDKKIGRYRILNRVAVGGMAEIFRAETTAGKIIAIKKILPEHTNNQKFIRMFFDEAKIMLTLKHPNIVQLYDFGRVENDYFLAMEWVEGKPLSSLIHQQKKQRVPFPPGLVCYIALEIICGLEYAHTRRDSYNRELGIVHRDISPPNILVSKEGEVKIADFGIAKAASNVSFTNPGILKGKYSYMSPEQANGKNLDARSDIFSCATMFYEMLASTRLFLGDTDLATLYNVRKKKIPSLAGHNVSIPSDFEKVIMRGLRRSRFSRYQSTREMANDLENVYNSNFADISSESLKGFFQFLLPRAPIYENEEEKRRVIADWGYRIAESSFKSHSNVVKQHTRKRTIIVLFVFCLSAVGLFCFRSDVLNWLENLKKLILD